MKFKKYYSKFLNFWLTTKWTEDDILIHRKEPYILWNFHHFVKQRKIKEWLYVLDKGIATIFEIYSITHEDEESYTDSLEGEDEVDSLAEWFDLEEENVEDLTPLEEIFEEIFNPDETPFSKFEENHPISFGNQFLYEIFEIEFHSYETTEGEILGGILSPLEEIESDYRDHSKTFSTFTEQWLTCLFLIPVAGWTSTHEFVLLYQVCIAYIFYKDTYNRLKQIKDYEVDPYDEIDERLSEITSPTRSFFYSLLTRSFLFVYEDCLLKFSIFMTGLVFLPPLMLPVFADLRGFWKSSLYQEHLLTYLSDEWLDRHEGHCIICGLAFIIFVWFFIFLPAMPIGLDEGYFEDDDSFSRNFGPLWRSNYNLVTNPHPEFPNPLSRQEHLEAPITIDPEWLVFEFGEEKWLIITGAFHFYLLENRRNIKKVDWINWMNWVRFKKTEVPIPKEDQKFEASQFSVERLTPGYIFWCISEPILAYSKQEIFQKWSSSYITQREKELYGKVKEGIFRWKRANRYHPGLPTKEENLRWIPGVYGRYKEKIEHQVDKGKRKNLYSDVTTFYNHFWSSCNNTDISVDAAKQLPNLDRYLYWAVKRNEQIKKRRKKKTGRRISFYFPVLFSKFFFFFGGKIIVPLIFLFLKCLSTVSLWIYFLRDILFWIYQNRILRGIVRYLIFPIIYILGHFIEKRIRGVLLMCLLVIALFMKVLNSRNFFDLWEDEEEGTLWWINELKQTYFSSWLTKKVKGKPMDVTYLVMTIFGNETNGVGSRPMTHPLLYFSWFHHWFRREFLGVINYTHGIGFDPEKEEIFEKDQEAQSYSYNTQEHYYEYLYQTLYGRGRNCDIEMSMQKKAQGLGESHGPRRSIFGNPKKTSKTPTNS